MSEYDRIKDDLMSGDFEISQLRSEVERLKAENMALRGALGYEVPADTPDNLFVNGIAEALQQQLAAKDEEIAAMKADAEKERKRRCQSAVDRLHNLCEGLAKCPNCGFDFEDEGDEA